MSHPPDSVPSKPSTTSRRNASLVVVIVGVIVGFTWLLGERNDYASIGTGGINATLLPKVGELAPDLVTFDTEGRLVRLSDLRGQPVWLNFWGSWCPPCRAEFPDLQLAYEELQPQGLVMLGIAMREDPIKAQDYADRMGGTFPILADPGYLSSIIPEDEYPEARALVTSYTVNNFPTHIFIDRDGTVRFVVLSTLDYGEAMAYGEAIIASAWPTSTRSSQVSLTAFTLPAAWERSGILATKRRLAVNSPGRWPSPLVCFSASRCGLKCFGPQPRWLAVYCQE